MSQTGFNSSQPATDLSGRTLGDYVVLRRLGRGAMAEVYLAEQAALRRQVALKVLKPELAGDETYIARFRMEAQAAASLVHANIVQVYDVGCIDSVHYIAQEYVQGQNLGQVLARWPLPDARRIVSVMRQVAAALHKAGEQGIVHRDIKPENIMLTRDGEVKVADFGLARLTGEAAGLHLTQAGVTLGTPLYMSPEQVEGKTLDPRSDLYSVGCTVYHLMTGHPPFTADTALGVAMQHLKKQPERLEPQRPDLPPALCRIVHRLLAKDPAERYGTARELLVDLRRLGIDSHDDTDEATDGFVADATEGESVDAAITAATQQLQAVMQRSRPSWRERAPYIISGLILVAAFAIGFELRQWSRDPFLLASAENTPRRQATAERQWLYASKLNTEAAWKSVEEYFPDKKDRYQVLRARQGLARLYLDHGQLDKAEGVFDSLAALHDPQDQEFRAFGLAGKFVILCLREENNTAATLFAKEIMPLFDHLKSDQLPDAEMQGMLLRAMRKNNQALNQKKSAEMQWLEERLGD